MPEKHDILLINAHVEIPAQALLAIKENWKQASPAVRATDPADELNRVISRFLAQADFLSFAKDPANYK